MSRYFVKKFRHFGKTIVVCRGVTRLDGAWGEKQVWRPYVRTWGLFGNKCTVLKQVLYDIVLTFWSPAMIRRPGNCAALLPSLRLWCYSTKIRKFSENKQIFKSERHELLFREHLQFSNTIAYRMDLAQTVNKGYWRQFKFLRVGFVSLQILPHAFFRRGPVLFC